MGVLSVKMLASSDQTWSYPDLRQVILDVIAQSGGGGGGAPAGIPEAPEDGNLYGRENAAWDQALPITGGTLTGQLVVKGDQFDQSIATTITPAILFENSSGGNQIGICVDQYGDGINIIKPNGASAFIRLDPGGAVLIGPTSHYGTYIRLAGVLTIGTDMNNDLTLSCAGMTLGQGLPMDGFLHVDQTTGDLIISQVTGPNAGKSVNLTAGHWA